METQDHKVSKQLGHEGQVHVCHTCGWPFPNPHPSARHRRAHKKVCGKIEGYKLGDDVTDKTQVMDGSDSEHVSDDEGKNPSGKVVENTSIIWKSSSGVGSRSSRSTKSEEELFADAATDFADGSVSGGATEGVMQRFYSMQTDFDDTNYTAETASADNACPPNLLIKDHQNEVQTIPNLTSENDTVQTDPIEQTKEEFSKTPHEQHFVSNACKEIDSSGANPEPGVSYNDPALEALENVSGLRDTNVEIQGPISALKSTEVESAGFKNNVEHLNIVADGLGNFSSIDPSFDIIDATNESASKLNSVMEDHGLKVESRDDLHVLAVPDAFPLHAHSEVLVEDPEVGDSKKISSKNHDLESIDGMEGKIKHDIWQNSVVEGDSVGVPGQSSSNVDSNKLSSVVGTDFMTESFELEKVSKSVEEQKPGVLMKNILPEGDNSAKYSTEHVLLEMDSVEIAEKEMSGSSLLADSATSDIPTQGKVSSGVEEQLSDVSFVNVFPESDSNAKNSKGHVLLETDSGEIKEKKLSGSSLLADCATGDIPAQGTVSSGVEEKKSDVSFENVLPEGDISAKNSKGHVLLEMDSGEITAKELSGTSVLADSATSDIPAQSKELGNILKSKDTGNDGEIGDVQTHLEGNESSEGKGNTPGCGLSIAGSHDGIEKPFEPENTYNHVESDVTHGIGDVMVDRALPLVENTGTSLGGRGSIDEDDDGKSALKSDHLDGSISNIISDDALKVRENALQSSTNDTTTYKLAEETSGVVERDGDNPIRQHLAIAAVDVPDSLSQADSLDGNWGSVSVMSALSDTPPTFETPSMQSQASPTEQNTSMEPKSLMDSQLTDGQTSDDRNAGVNKMEGKSEIQTLEEQQKVTHSETAWPSSSASHVENASLGGKRNEEIIAKVTDWSTGKNHSPLKTLLGEATARSREESPVHYNQSATSMPLKDEIPVANNGVSKAEKVIQSSNEHATDTLKDEVGKEWNSPARYPVNINTEKKRGKSRPWMPFLCCSSVSTRYDGY